MAELNPYLTFDGNCREAMEFYKSCLGGELVIQTVGQSPVAGEMPESLQGAVMHANLKSGNIVIMASDMINTKDFVKGNNISLTLQCSSLGEIESHFAKLSDGGEVKMPLEEQFWGAMYGEVADKFGVRWLFNYDSTQKNHEK